MTDAEQLVLIRAALERITGSSNSMWTATDSDGKIEIPLVRWFALVHSILDPDAEPPLVMQGILPTYVRIA